MSAQPDPYARQFYVNNGQECDPAWLDAVSDPAALIARKPALAHQFQAIRSVQDRLWDLRQPGFDARSQVGGSGGMKWVASIPKDVFLAAEALEPRLFSDPTIFHAWLDRQRKHGFNYSTRKV